MLRDYYDVKYIKKRVDKPYAELTEQLNKAVDKLEKDGANAKILKIRINNKIAYHSYVVEKAFNIELELEL